MRAVSRIGLAMVSAGLALAPSSLLAQSAPAPTTNTPATDSIGPRELSNFSLGGTATKPAETPPATTPDATRTRSQPAATTTAERTTSPAPSAREAERRSSESVARAAQASAAAAPSSSGSRSVQNSAFDLPTPAAATPANAPQSGFAAEPESSSAPLAPEQKLLLWPWLLVALVLGAGGAVLLWRRRSQQAFAGGPEIDAFVAPEPAPAPPRAATLPRPVAAAPTPPAPEPAAPKPVGIVSSRLRPWVEVGFSPIGCLVDDERVLVEFEVQLTNSGTAPAREVLVEASMFNAGASQEQDIGGFFAKPIGQGERIEVIAPLQQMSIRTSLVAPRQNIQMFEVGGKQVFVPLVAFNVLYRAPGSGGQTSAAFMLGRETKTDKLGPLRADLGPKVFGNLGTRPLEVGVRV